MIPVPLSLLRFVLWPEVFSVLVNVPCDLEKKDSKASYIRECGLSPDYIMFFQES